MLATSLFVASAAAIRSANLAEGAGLVVCVLFMTLGAYFLAAIQVLIYIGAVAILMMFGIMLTRNIQGDEARGVSKSYGSGSGAG